MRLFAFLALVVAAFAPRISGAGRLIKVWVELRDKGPAIAKGNASASGRAYEDASLYAPYLRQLRAAGFAPDAALKWQNRVSGWMDSEKLPALSRLSMVRRVEELPRKSPRDRALNPDRLTASAFPRDAAADAFQPVFAAVGALGLRTELLGRGKTPGRGIRIAVIDASFDLGHEGFAHLWRAGAIVDQFDFVRRAPGAVGTGFSDSHGAAVLSLLAGRSGAFEGLAPDAGFLLYRSEDAAGETYAEEDYVAEALERAVDSGAQVVNISLGYRYNYSDGSPDLPYSAFDGRTRPSSVAATMAARRGVLVCVSMGNYGPGSKTVGAPADADSVLTVGVMDAYREPCFYSSHGPAFDGRLKPEISTLGPYNCSTPVADPATPSAVAYFAGTSFASPVVAGIAALLRQLHPDVSTQSLRLALMATAGKTLRPDNAVGYGLVDGEAAHRVLRWNPGEAALGAPVRPAAGWLAWERSAPRTYIPWRKGLQPASAQLWDLSGRSMPVRGGAGGPGYWIEAGVKAPGIYVFRLPVRTDSAGP